MKNFISILTLFIFFSCGNRASETTDEASYDMAPAAASEEVKSSSDGFSGGDVSKAKEEPEDKTKADLTAASPKLIKTGFLTIEVENYKESRKKIKDLVIKSGGYLGNESETNETYRIANELTIRIPAKAFDQMMEGLMAEGIKTDTKRIEVQDVGEEYADLTARIEAKRAVEKRYLEILNKANKISDILEVEEKLRVIREETEAAQGRVKYLESQVSYSTIHLSFYKTLDVNYIPPSGPGFFSRIWEGLARGWENVLSFIVGVAYLWPLWLVVVLIYFWFRKRHIWPFRKKQQK
jgi:hypothetical protein